MTNQLTNIRTRMESIAHSDADLVTFWEYEVQARSLITNFVKTVQNTIYYLAADIVSLTKVSVRVTAFTLMMIIIVSINSPTILLPSFSQIPGSLPAYIYDRGDLISTHYESLIDSYLRSLDDATTTEIIIYTIPSFVGLGTNYRPAGEFYPHYMIKINYVSTGWTLLPTSRCKK